MTISIQSTQLFCKAVWPLILRAGLDITALGSGLLSFARVLGIKVSFSHPLPFSAKTSAAWHCDDHSDQDARSGRQP